MVRFSIDSLPQEIDPVKPESVIKGTFRSMSVFSSYEGKFNIVSARWNETETFIQNLAHDLRQPLSEIEALIYCLETGAAADNARIREVTNQMRNQVERTDAILCAAVRDAHGVADLRPSAGASLSVSPTIPGGV